MIYFMSESYGFEFVKYIYANKIPYFLFYILEFWDFILGVKKIIGNS